MPRIIRDASALLKPAAIAVVLAIAAACGGGGRPPVDPADAPEWPERVVEPRTASDRPPLLVLLHGIGGDENDLVRLAPYVDARFRVVSLRAPRTYGPGHSWFPIDVRANGTMRPHADVATAVLLDLARWLAAAPARLGTDPARTYVLGFSQGAMMSVGLVRTYPELVAGAVVLSGGGADEAFPLVAPRAAVGRVALFVGHGTEDDVLPVDRGRAIRDAFADLATDLTYREYPIAHGVNEDEMRDVAAWLAERLDGAGAA
jgi:phospholipase/carboxylesterase